MPPRTRWLAFPWEILLVLGVTCLLAFVLVYLPSGLLAAAVIDGAAPWQATFGSGEPPVPYRAFLRLQALLPYIALGATIVVVLHVTLRRLVRRAVSFGDNLAWDGLLSPLAFAALAAMVGLLAMLVRERSLPFGGDLSGVGLAAIALAGALGLVGFACGLGVRSRFLRRVAVGVAAVLALAPLARLGADAWGAARLRAVARAVEPELAAERQSLASLGSPVLREPALDENAAPRYRALMARVKLDYAERAALGKAASAAPLGPLDPEAGRVFAGLRELLPPLHEALRCNRCVWDLKPSAPNEPVLNLLPSRILGDLLLLEGHEQARTGDGRGAAERYLDAVRLGGDFRGGNLLSNLVGSSIARGGLEALGSLLVSDTRPPLVQVKAEMDKLEGHLPTLPPALRRERLMMLGGLGLVDKADDVFGVPPVLPILVPYRLLVAQATEAVDPRWRAMERASTLGDPAEAERILATLGAGPTWNPAFRLIAPTALPRSRVIMNEVAARFALARAALAIEEAAGASHRYPGDAAAVSLSRDPMSTSGLLHYARAADGGGYRVWSVGVNGWDDGGTANDHLDIVLERKASR
jgi:hypothetical protein